MLVIGRRLSFGIVSMCITWAWAIGTTILLSSCSLVVSDFAASDSIAAPVSSEPASLPTVSTAQVASTASDLNTSPNITLSLDKALTEGQSIEVAIGSTALAEDVQSWTDFGTQTNLQVTSPDFRNNSTYHVSLRLKSAVLGLGPVVSVGSWIHNPMLISSTSLTSNTGFSYVAVDVDWTRKIAYLASRESGKCLTAVDFADENNPVILKILGTATTPATLGQTCLGVRLYNSGTRLVLAGNGSSIVEVWDLGSDPRALSWTKLSGLAVSSAKRIDVVSVNSSLTKIYAARRFGMTVINVSEPSGSLTQEGTYTTALDGLNEMTFLGTHLLSASYQTSSSILDVSSSAFALLSTIPYGTAGFPSNWSWAATKSEDDSIAYMGGHGGAIIQKDGSGNISLVYKHGSTFSTDVIRDATLVSEGGVNYLYSILSTNKIITKWNLSDPTNPVLIKYSNIIDAVKEGYGIRIDPSSNRGIVITNGGMFYIINTQNLDAATSANQLSFPAL